MQEDFDRRGPFFFDEGFEATEKFPVGNTGER
jgi:hypothetical protein